MSAHKQPTESLEQLIDRTLSDLPLRHAPTNLQAQVFAELQRRAALPWWRRQFTRWPMGVRMAFLVLCLGLADLSTALLRWLSAAPRGVEIQSLVSQPITWVERIGNAALAAQEFFALLLRHAPTPLLYGGLVSVIVLYVVLFGIGAAAYRTLYANR